MTDLERIKTMMSMQEELNTLTCGVNWKLGTTNNNRSISWRRCIYMECAELMDSLNWKHWKDIHQLSDLDNARIEVVDIWHFVLSLAIESNASASDILSEKKDITLSTIIAVDSMVSDTMAGDIDDVIGGFFRLMQSDLIKMDLEELYKLYIGKNILNKFRQQNGYKEGSYQKIWDGVEDNVVLQRLLKTIEDPEELMMALKGSYKP